MAFIRFIIILGIIFFSSVAYAEEDKELKCLVEAVYHEARSESFTGQLAVANVIIERANLSKFPNTICKVVHAGKYWKGNIVRNKCAFSYYCDGKKEWSSIEKEALDTAYQVSALALDGVTLMSTLGATHYHASYVSPSWTNNMERLQQIGTHIFYVD
jgi:spore germination cell wall hydrolase CwlJ-like protein